MKNHNGEFMRRSRSIRFLLTSLTLLSAFTLSACRLGDRTPQAPMSDTLHPTEAKPAHIPSQVDTAIQHAPTDTASIAHPVNTLPPIATPIAPEKLAKFMPAMAGFTTGELQQETKVRKNFNSSRAAQTFAKDGAKFTVEINDYAYVPFLYEPFDKYKDAYLDDDNDERTETTTIAGFHAVQTWGKKSFEATIYLFVGRRYIVKVSAEGVKNIGEARAVIETMDLHGLERVSG